MGDIRVGVVVNCSSVNILEKPRASSEVLFRVNEGSEIAVDLPHFDSAWLHVRAAGGVEVDGYCVRSLVELKT